MLKSLEVVFVSVLFKDAEMNTESRVLCLSPFVDCLVYACNKTERCKNYSLLPPSLTCKGARFREAAPVFKGAQPECTQAVRVCF